MRTLLHRTVLVPLLLLSGLPVQAATWILDPDNSSVVFKYSYARDPYEGKFTNIEAVFDIDPMSPGTCNFSVTIHMADIEVDDPETLDYMHDEELFDVEQFPTSRFEAEKCSLTGVNSFTSDGMLTIRDVTRPISFPFELEVETAGDEVRFHLTSEVSIQRLEYGVGQGYWANTAEIPNDVLVEIDVYAVQQ